MAHKISYNGQSAPISKKVADILTAALTLGIAHDEAAITEITKNEPGMPPLTSPALPGSSRAAAALDRVKRNRDICKMILPVTTTSTLTKPTGGALAAPTE